MDSKDGLVARVWSDSGDVSVGEVTYTTYTYGDGVRIPTRRCEVLEDGFGNVLAWRVTDATEPGDPNAKPALTALTRVGGNKRGPGWCDE